MIFGVRKHRTLQERMVTKEMREKGFESWNPIVPVNASCLDKNGKFLWKKEFRPANRYFSEDGRFLLAFSDTGGSEKIQIVDADSGDLTHEQRLTDWYKRGEGKILALASDAEKKNLAMIIEERSVEGIEWHEHMGGIYFKRTGQDKRRDLGYRFVVYDLSEILVR